MTGYIFNILKTNKTIPLQKVNCKTRDVSIGHGCPSFSTFVTKIKNFRTDKGKS